MKRLWITDSGIIHHRKPRMDATEYVEAQPDAEILRGLSIIEKYIYTQSEKAQDGIDIIKQALSRAEQREQNHE